MKEEHNYRACINISTEDYVSSISVDTPTYSNIDLLNIVVKTIISDYLSETMAARHQLDAESPIDGPCGFADRHTYVNVKYFRA